MHGYGHVAVVDRYAITTPASKVAPRFCLRSANRTSLSYEYDCNDAYMYLVVDSTRAARRTGQFFFWGGGAEPSLPEKYTVNQKRETLYS